MRNPTDLLSHRALDVVLAIAWISLTGLLFYRAILLFGPASSHVPGFNSDAAIPVLMARGPAHGLFSAYYWGQDRFGAWPYLLASTWSAITGWAWSPERLATAQTLWLMLGAVALVGFRSIGWMAGAAFTATLMLHPAVRRSAFHPQPYAWQFTALLLSWLLVRSMLFAKGKLVALAALSWLAMFMAIWVSPTSGIFLLGILAIEAWRSRERSAKADRSSQGWHRIRLAALLLFSAIASEALLRWGYHHAALAEFGNSYETLLRGDRGHLVENAQRLVLVGLNGTVWWVPLLGLVGLTILGVLLMRGRDDQSEVGVGSVWESFFLAAGACFIATANFAVCVALQHVRVNQYSDRYLCSTHVFLDLMAAVSWTGIALWAIRGRSVARWAPAALGIVVLSVSLVKLPAPAREPQYERSRRLALALVDHGPSVLLGEYWSVYPLAALAPPGTLVPVTPDDEGGPRTPFNVQRLVRARQVEVLHSGGRFLDSSGHPLPHFSQHGVLLEYVGPATGQGEDQVVSLYRNPSR